MPEMKLLIANRGEIAIRIARTAAEMEIPTVAVYSQDDHLGLHVGRAETAVALPGTGAAAYLDTEAILSVAVAEGCTAIHPGYGFLSENAEFARRCAAAGITFVGPGADALELFGNKVSARNLAAACDVPVLAGTTGETTLEEAEAFFAGLPGGAGMVIKAIAGGGGRGMRIVTAAAEIPTLFRRCQSEARASFGNPALYVEQLAPHARHIEVQVVADSHGGVTHLWERECSLQRRHQKLVEVAPAPGLDPRLRVDLLSAATTMASAAGYQSLGTFEFLVDDDVRSFVFIEANPRVQVEHTVTEEVTGIDLVRCQLLIAQGATLTEAGLDPARIPDPRGFAIQSRVNMETMGADGSPRPAGGTISVFDTPGGAGVRIEALGYSGYQTSARYDSLLAKVIIHSPSPVFEDAVRKAIRVLSEFRIEGVGTNIPFLRALFAQPEVATNQIHTRFIEEHIGELVAATNALVATASRTPEPAAAAPGAARVGIKVDARDPLAVLNTRETSVGTKPALTGPIVELPVPEGTVAVRAPMQGTIVSIDVAAGDTVRAGQQVLVMEAMKMEHVISAIASGIVRPFDISPGEAVPEGLVLVLIEEREVEALDDQHETEIDLDYIRPDLDAVRYRHSLLEDAARPAAVERRRKTGQRTARENVYDICDHGSFIEYGGLVIAAQRNRRALQDLIENTPADGLITGTGLVNGEQFDEAAARCVVMSYDYTVFAGTQGQMNHRKHDRMFSIAEEHRMPVIFFTEGGGGRPGDGDGGGEGMKNPTFYLLARLHGRVPTIGVNSGRAFAGNAAVLGFCDVVIATRNSTIGMGGPAMVEGGGLGVFRPEEIGPIDVQEPNGVIDILVDDEAAAVAAAKKYIAYFQGRTKHWEVADQRLLRRIIPENRLRIYDVREVIETLADVGSVLELRRNFGPGMVTALARIEGRPIGIVANNPSFLAGAITSDGADKASRFMRLCNAYGLPILSLCDTPGIMVGPEAEKTALVRHSSRVFVTGASLEVPMFTVFLRKAYGLGAMAMAGGSFRVPMLAVAWPTGEFGGMGLEGSVKLGMRKELEAVQDIEERKALYDSLVARAYERGKALNSAMMFEFDDVIDPADTRRWLTGALGAVEFDDRPTWKSKRAPGFIDTW